MARVPRIVVLLAVSLVFCVGLAGTASALSITVAEEGPEITIDVVQNGEPVRGATVVVSGVTRETPLDGEYTTDSNGQVTFGDEKTEKLSGVVHLRITVDSAGSYKSVLTTFTRSPEISSSPMGYRMSVSLQESVAGTHGKIAERLNSSDSGIRGKAKRVDSILRKLGDARFRREVLGRDLAAGEISPGEFYLRAVGNARASASLRGALREKVEELSGYDEGSLRDEGVDTDALANLRSEIGDGRSIDTDRRLLE